MDQAAVDEVAKLFVQARNTGARLDPLPARKIWGGGPVAGWPSPRMTWSISSCLLIA